MKPQMDSYYSIFRNSKLELGIGYEMRDLRCFIRFSCPGSACQVCLNCAREKVEGDTANAQTQKLTILSDYGEVRKCFL